MKSLPCVSLALIALLLPTGCASDEYYDLGFKIGSSAEFLDSWDRIEKLNQFVGGESKVNFNQLCEGRFQSYRDDEGGKSYVLPTRENVESLIQGCRDGFVEATRP